MCRRSKRWLAGSCQLAWIARRGRPSEKLICRLEVDRLGVDRFGLGLRFAYFFGRFAPYLERACRRFSTPDASSVPRTVW